MPVEPPFERPDIARPGVSEMINSLRVLLALGQNPLKLTTAILERVSTMDLIIHVERWRAVSKSEAFDERCSELLDFLHAEQRKESEMENEQQKKEFPFRIIVREAQDHERNQIERRTGKALASDHCVAVWLDATIIGWGDDYGTFHALRGPTDGRVEEAGEALLEAASNFWAALHA